MAMIHYCHECGTRLPREDLANGQAVEIDGRAYCRLHVPLDMAATIVEGEAGANPPPLVMSVSVSVNRTSGRQAPRSSRRTTPQPLPQPAARRRGSNAPVVVVVAVSTIVLGVVVALLVSATRGPGGEPPASAHPGNAANGGGRGGAGTTNADIEAFRRNLSESSQALVQMHTASNLQLATRVANCRLAWERCRELGRLPIADTDRQAMEALQRGWDAEYAAALGDAMRAEAKRLVGHKEVAAAATFVGRAVSGSDPEHWPVELCNDRNETFGQLRTLADDLTHMAAQWIRTQGLMDRADAVRKTGRLEDAVRGYTGVLREMDTRFDALVSRAWCYRRLGDTDRAMADVDRALGVAPGYTDGWFLRAYIRDQLGDKAGALEDYSHAVECDPANAMVYNNRGNTRLELGDRDGAMADFTKATELEPANKYGWYNRGRIHHSEGRTDSAIADYKRALACDDDYFVAHFNLAVLLRDNDQLDEALLHYRAAAKAEPRRYEPWYHMGRILAATDRERALECLRRAKGLCTDAGDSRTIDELLARVGRGG
ncbi:MAG: tetratricopeptide repeat protein [Planctomycetota bacterium]